jgi:hypothetical protein
MGLMRYAVNPAGPVSPPHEPPAREGWTSACGLA